MFNGEVTLAGREPVAEGTIAFRFEKPAGFEFTAGQAVNLSLIDPPPQPNSARRVFSLASAPYEDDLVIATRMRDGSFFKAALHRLPDGAKLRLRGPMGALTLHEDAARAAVFIAGGIGITPFRSMLREAAHRRLPHRLFLVYSNRRPEDSAFLAELQQMEAARDNFRLLATMTDMEKSALPWEGHRGLVDAEAVRRFAGGTPAPIYYVAGPPAMTKRIKAALAAAGVHPGDIRSEEFYGY